MAQDDGYRAYLRTAHQFLALGQVREAERVILQVADQIPMQDEELCYLRAWCASQQNNWEEVAQYIHGFSASDEERTWLAEGSLRRRRPVFLLNMGQSASTLGYVRESLGHYQHGLHLLDERRMNIPEVRTRLHVLQGDIFLQIGPPSEALDQYEAALQACDGDSPALLVRLYSGLAEAQSQCGQNEEALVSVQQAWELLEGDAGIAESSKERLCLLFGALYLKSGDPARALSYVEEAVRLAEDAQDSQRLAAALLMRAEAQYAQHMCAEARCSCETALRQTSKGQRIYGQLALLCGKIIEANGCQTPDTSINIDEAMHWYEEAQTTFAELDDVAGVAAVSIEQARLLESRGKPAQALEFWKKAYQRAGTLKRE